jgi:hypothetical protein
MGFHSEMEHHGCWTADSQRSLVTSKDRVFMADKKPWWRFLTVHKSILDDHCFPLSEQNSTTYT